jgi:hypothetical protein
VTHPEIQKHFLIQIKALDNQLMVTINKKKQPKTLTLTELVSDPQYRAERNFFKAQLNLYSALCKNRNGLSCEYVSRKFPLAILRDHIFKENPRDSNMIPDDLKATFLRLIIVVYVDRAPRRIVEKPDLVRSLVGSDGADYVTPVGRNSGGRGEYVDADDLDIGFGGTGGGKPINLLDTPPDSPRNN